MYKRYRLEGIICNTAFAEADNLQQKLENNVNLEQL